MSPIERWSLHLAALITGGTGLLNGLLRWFGERAGEFGPEPHPWVGLAQHLHVLVALSIHHDGPPRAIHSPQPTQRLFCLHAFGAFEFPIHDVIGEIEW